MLGKIVTNFVIFVTMGHKVLWVWLTQNQKVHEKNHLYRVRNDQGQILAPIFGRSAGAPQ